MKRNIFKRIIRKVKKLIVREKSNEEREKEKMRSDYDYLISKGVETEYGNVFLGGLPIIQKHSNARIIIGKGVTLLSDSNYNVAGINHPVILSACADGAIIELKDGCGMSGTSVVAVKKIVIGAKTMLGANTNVYDTDFHPIDPVCRLNQSDILEANFSSVYISNNVWIGANSTVLKGVTIGDNSVIGSNSLVNKDIPHNCIYAGIPAKFIRYIN